MVRLALALVGGLMLCLPLGVTAGIHNTQGAFTAMHKPPLTSRTEVLFARSPATVSPSVTSAFRVELSSMAILIEELDRTDPSPLAMVTEGWSAMTAPVADALRWQVVTPLDWPGEPIPAKVLMIGLKRGRFLGYAVADLEERALKVYSGGHISFQVDWAQGGSITARGDVLIKDGRVGYLVPGGDFTEPSLPVRPSRYVPKRDGIGPYIGFVTDPSGSLVWMSQNIYMRHSVYMPGGLAGSGRCPISDKREMGRPVQCRYRQDCFDNRHSRRLGNGRGPRRRPVNARKT